MRLVYSHVVKASLLFASVCMGAKIRSEISVNRAHRLSDDDAVTEAYLDGFVVIDVNKCRCIVIAMRDF